MKHLNSILVAAFLFMIVGVANAQDENNPWAVEIGINAVDVYPVGLSETGRIPVELKGKLFDEYFNQNDHWSILPSVSKVAVGRYLGDGFTFAAVGTINKIDKIFFISIKINQTKIDFVFKAHFCTYFNCSIFFWF